MVLRGTSEDAGARREPLPLECIGPELDGSIAVLWKQRQTDRQTDMPLFACSQHGCMVRNFISEMSALMNYWAEIGTEMGIEWE